MQENSQYYQFQTPQFEPVQKITKKKKLGPWLYIIMFMATCITTVMGGVYWMGRDPYDISNFHLGITYASLVILFLTFHEFGHYFAAKYHKIDTTLPLYIPMPMPDLLNPFGTMGAVIRIRDPIKTRKALFDIGIAGPIAGFVVSVAALIYGLLTLPSIDYLYSIHPEYVSGGLPPVNGITFANTLLYSILSKVLPLPQNAFLPPMNEIYHYPFLCAGWFGLFVTSLNLMPIGQLDGGHITYALLGSKHKIVARFFFGLLIIMSAIGGLNELGWTNWYDYGSLMWVVWVVLLLFLIKIDHPPIYDAEPIGTPRKLLGVFALIMFLCSFTPSPINVF